MQKKEIQFVVEKFLNKLNENNKINNEVLANTPRRVANAWLELLDGYNQNDADFYKTFEVKDNNNLIIIKAIDFVSVCEHHLMLFKGTVKIGYRPDNKVLGLSKFGRIVDCFSKRLQLQEKLTTDIGNSILQYLQPKDLFIVIEAEHSCMGCRGIKKQNAKTITLFTKGKFDNYNEIDLINLG